MKDLGADDRARRATPLKRAVSRNLLLLFIVGDILGGGIYALAGQVGLEVGGLLLVCVVGFVALGAGDGDLGCAFEIEAGASTAARP